MDLTVPSDVPTVPVHEIRDYERVNALVARLLGRGCPRLRLAGVGSQRLLLAGLRGGWRSVIEVDGPAGPELAAGLDSPHLVVVARHGAADGAGRDLSAGSLVIQGTAGDALAYRQSGGRIVATGPVGHRAGLQLGGGLLVLGGPAGRLLGERQSGGRIVALDPALGPHAGFARLGGRLVVPGSQPDPADARALVEALQDLMPWLPPGFGDRDAP